MGEYRIHNAVMITTANVCGLVYTETRHQCRSTSMECQISLYPKTTLMFRRERSALSLLLISPVRVLSTWVRPWWWTTSWQCPISSLLCLLRKRMCPPTAQFYIATIEHVAWKIMSFSKSSVHSAVCDPTTGLTKFTVVHKNDGYLRVQVDRGTHIHRWTEFMNMKSIPLLVTS